ncbi:MAG: iron ABC transporter permease, partial [Anaerolineaceae bacterium]
MSFKGERVRNTLGTLLLWVLPAAFLGVFFFHPLLAVFRLGLEEDLSTLFTRSTLLALWRPLRFTFYQAGLSTLLTLLLGLPSAYLFARFRFPGKRLLQTLTALPFILPTVVVAAAFNSLLGPRGWVNLALMGLFNLAEPPLQWVNSLGAILLAHVFYNTTIVIRMVGNAWARLDPRLEGAAQALGANRWRTLREVTLPLLRSPIMAAALLVFLFDFTSFGVILLLGGPHYATLEVEIYIQAMQMLNLPLASLLSIFQLMCTLLLTLAYSRLTSIQQKVPLTPRSERAGARAPHGWREKLAVTLMSILLILLLVTPLLSLAARSVVKLEPARGERAAVSTGFTLENYQELFINRRGSLFYVPPITAMRNSLQYAATTVGISLILGVLAAYALNRRSRINRVLDPLLMLPLGASAVTLGLGFIVVFNRPPIDLRNFPMLLPIAHSLVALPFVVRAIQPALNSIPSQIRQAGAVLGASPRRVWAEIDLPLLLKPLLAAATFAFTISLGEFGATS